MSNERKQPPLVNVICMKWGTKYGSDYVNNLYSMVKRHLTLPFRFVCLTDDNKGLVNDIDSFPIPPLDIPRIAERGWDKLVTFSNPLYDLEGEVLFLDLDVLVVDNIDCFFTFDAKFAIINDWIKKDITGNSSVYRFTANKHQDIIENFKLHHNHITKRLRNEQEYLSHYVYSQNILSYWPDDWCKSFKYHCIEKGIKQWFKIPVKPPKAKIIVFHGNPNPHDAITGKSGKWYRRVLPTAWVSEHWL